MIRPFQCLHCGKGGYSIRTTECRTYATNPLLWANGWQQPGWTQWVSSGKNMTNHGACIATVIHPFDHRKQYIDITAGHTMDFQARIQTPILKWPSRHWTQRIQTPTYYSHLQNTREPGFQSLSNTQLVPRMIAAFCFQKFLLASRAPNLRAAVRYLVLLCLFQIHQDQCILGRRIVRHEGTEGPPCLIRIPWDHSGAERPQRSKDKMQVTLASKISKDKKQDSSTTFTMMSWKFPT